MNIEVTKDEVKILEGSDLPNENEYKITKCYFNFDEYTESFQVKRAIFTILSTGEMYETDIINDECDIPVEVLKKEYERVKIGVYGYNIGENEELLNRFSPSYDEFIVPTGSYEEGALSPEPITPSQYDLYSQALQQGLNEVDDKLQEVDDTVSQKISEMDQKIDETDEAITRAERLNIEASKSGKTTTVTITKQDGSTKSEDILDGEDGTDGENGIGLQYDWSGTSLGVKREDEALFTYVNLEGKKGDPGAINLLIVNELPLVGSEDTLYFVPKTDTGESDMYDEYVWINNDWELVGTKQITVDLSDYYTKQEVDNLIPTQLSELSSDSTHRLVTDNEKSTWNGKQDKINDLETIRSGAASGKTAVQFNDLATVATSGSYNDLSNKPTIPTKLSQLSSDVTHRVVTDSEKTTWNSKYDKPSSGIPKTDLASGVQTSLEKADTALQSISSSDVTTALGYTPYNSTNPNGYTSNTGTITGVKMNGSTIASSGVADLGTVITEHQDISGKQDKIVAGTNISIASDGKTISATDTTYSNATATTAGLMSSDDKTKLNGIETGATKNLNYYGTCATSAATQAKVVVCEGFVLENGATISVLFTNAQTYNGTPTLNVNSTGAKNVHFRQGIRAVQYIWSAGEIIDFTYDGTYWVMHRSALASTIYYGLAKYSDSLTSISSQLGATSKAINTAMANIISGAPIYTASSTYAVGDRVRYSNNVWECITAITHAEVWTDAHWKTVAPLQEQIDDKQDLLVSGTNIKTINNQSILGSGNITIEGGGSGTVDTAMSDSSTNAVQNKVIKGYVDDIVGDIGTILDNINGEVIGG